MALRFVKTIASGETTFLVTHSVGQSCLDLVTRIVVMDQGRLIAAGPHKELIEACPVYRNLYRAQTHQKAG